MIWPASIDSGIVDLLRPLALSAATSVSDMRCPSKVGRCTRWCATLVVFPGKADSYIDRRHKRPAPLAPCAGLNRTLGQDLGQTGAKTDQTKIWVHLENKSLLGHSWGSHALRILKPVDHLASSRDTEARTRMLVFICSELGS
jgi:hypothetical protein